MLLDVEGLGPVQARYAVGADGMWSPLRRFVGGADGYRGDWHAFRQYVKQVSPRAGRELAVWFDDDLLPGYAWSFPLPDGHANVGYCVPRTGEWTGAQLSRTWADLLERSYIREFLGPRAVAEAPHRAWPIPSSIDRATASAGRVLFVGDAVAAADPMTGEGIGQALQTGVLAADALLVAGPDAPATAATRYEDALHHELLADHRMSAALSALLSGPRWRPWGGAPGRRLGVDATRVRPLALRGRAPRRGGHAAPLAPPLPGPIGRLRLTPTGLDPAVKSGRTLRPCAHDSPKRSASSTP